MILKNNCKQYEYDSVHKAHLGTSVNNVTRPYKNTMKPTRAAGNSMYV